MSQSDCGWPTTEGRTCARESHAAALRAGEWQGFACAMRAFDHASFTDALERSAAVLDAAIADLVDWSPARDQLLAAVAEHEVMHEGQLIRHMYALGHSLPASWRWA